MNTPPPAPLNFAGCLFLAAVLGGAPVEASAGAEAPRRLFQHPPVEYSTGPLWVWNDRLTEEQVRGSLRDLAEQHVYQVWVHPRPGLMTPYLSPDWFRMWKVSLEEAGRLGMKVWIYDENSYPSGFAGGLVPEAMPEARGRGLEFREVQTAPEWSAALIGVYQRHATGDFTNVTARARAGQLAPRGPYWVAAERRSEDSPWNGNRCYVNLLSPGVTEKFLEVTLEPYRRELGREFGKKIPGVFTDEPNIRPAGGLPWSEILPAEFQKRWGYDLLDHLPSLTQPAGDWRKVRHHYFQLLHEQFVAHWARPYHDYCEQHNLEWTGHYWEHEWPNCTRVPDNMAMYAWHQRPAIDCLMNQYAEHNHAQFGNVRMVKELSSVANQLGLTRTLCETYGAGGWDLRFEDMKRIGDWLEVLGVNTINQHLDYLTLRGARKRDHPQSFSYHEPWWEAYHVSADYLARVSAALSQGEQVNPVLVLEPTTTAWMYQGDNARLNEIGDRFFQLLMALEAAQVEYDLGCEDIIEHHGSIEHGKLRVGRRVYDRVILPPVIENLNSKTAALLRQIEVTLSGPKPLRIDGALPPGAQPAGGEPSSEAVIHDLVRRLKTAQTAATGMAIERATDDPGILFHHRRQVPGGEILFLVNTSSRERSQGVVSSKWGGVEEWDPYTGEIRLFPSTRDEDRLSVKFDLPPSGSLLLFFNEETPAQAPPRATVTTLAPEGPVTATRLEPNVLTLDYVTVTAGGETRTNVYTYQANVFAWKKHGFDRDPWDSAVQFKDELISRKFPADSGFEVSYAFESEGAPPKDLAIVIERPDLYTSITCNGRPLKWKRGDWWLDKDFGRLSLKGAARAGRNVVTLKAAPFTVFHEIEPAYVLGSFQLKPAPAGFVIAPEMALTMGDHDQPLLHSAIPGGAMWLSAGVASASDDTIAGASDPAPCLVFDLGRPTDLAAVLVWNYNENQTRELTSRGASRIRLTAARPADSGADPGEFDLDLGVFDLSRASGAEEAAQRLPVHASGARFIRLDCLANHNGVTFPASGTPPDSGFVGLSEVRFVASSQRMVEGVRILKASSELKSHDRLAQYVVNGAGLSSPKGGWNTQGAPFYAAGVQYTEHFKLAQPRGSYSVVLPDWCGSVASVLVNGHRAGWIDAPPFERDITRFLKKGENRVDVTVVGTLKNTLGPHHGNPSLGAAWPRGFQVAPESGPPPGPRYSTVAYGLFEPFVLKQSSEAAP